MTETHASSIASRVYDSFPSGNYCLPALLRILEVRETDAVATAAVECRATPLLLVNPAFVEEHAETPEKLLVLVLHELHHVILGHTRLYPRATALDNYAFDAVINATIAHLLPDPEYLAMFTDFYDEDSAVECFLRPAAGWKPGGRAVVPRALRNGGKGPEVRELAQLHTALYSKRGVGYDELRRALAPLLFARLGEGARVNSLPPLLGDHRGEKEGASSAGDLEGRAPALLEAVREIVERWPQPPQPILGRSYSSILEERRVRPVASPAQALQRAIRAVADLGGEGGAHRVPISSPVAITTAVPAGDRRSTVLRMLGQSPLLFENVLQAPRVRRGGEKVHVYVDVSGSVASLVPALYGALLASRELVHPVIHTFSTVISDRTLGELREGRVKSTGGTDVSCVAAHIRQHGVRRAVIVTDGYVGRPTGLDAATLRDAEIAVVLTPGPGNRGDLGDFAKHWGQLSSLAAPATERTR